MGSLVPPTAQTAMERFQEARPLLHIADPTFPYPAGRGTLIGDTRRVFCDGGYQAILNDIPTLTCACQCSDNMVDWEGEVPLCLEVTGDVIASLRVNFSECFRIPYNETCVVRYSVGDTRVGDRYVTEFFRGNGHLQGSLECAEVLAGSSTYRRSVECMLSWDDYFVHTDSNVSGMQTTAVCSLWQRGRVGQSSRKWRTKRFCDIRWWVSVVSYEFVHAMNPRAGSWKPVLGQQMRVSVELMEPIKVFHSNVGDERDELAGTFHHSGAARSMCIAEHDDRIGTEQSEFLETSTGSDGSKTLNTIWAVWGSSRRRTTRRIVSRWWGRFDGRANLCAAEHLRGVASDEGDRLGMDESGQVNEPLARLRGFDISVEATAIC